ncbi:hypothetical protein H8K52_09140 [Undibacterium seohonense]|uniref:Response regulatory domain-containing protein n=1 Tax=Undibacterium seohonense TaxID=1344950 RepID=A0ABR6X3Z2_9BURK|nr:hypothetical protein [Undibacterium seohonense]MBC3807507.1 hypothetical protein [Undibacterium seohonense]
MMTANGFGCETIQRDFLREGFMSITKKKWRSILCINENPKQINMQGMTLGSMANLSVSYCHQIKDASNLIREIVPDVVLLDLQDSDDAEKIVQGILATDTREAIELICLANSRQIILLSAVELTNEIRIIQKPVDILMLPELVLDILDDANTELNT